MGPRPRRTATALLCLLVACSLAAKAMGAKAESWIREPVGLLSLEGPAGAAPAIRSLAIRAPAILAQLEGSLDVRAARPFRILVVPPSGLSDSALARADEGAPPWAAGYMIPARRLGAIRIALAASYPYGTLESVLAHETTHLLLHDAATRPLPTWFQEGVATWAARRWSPEDMWIYARLLLTSEPAPLDSLDRPFHGSPGEAEGAYAASFAFVSWSANRRGPDFVADVLRLARAHPFEEAWETRSGRPIASDETAWRRESAVRYRWLPVLTASSTLWLGLALLTAVAGTRKRARARATRERWRAEEEDEGLDAS